jgi:hypothetical protein
MDAKISAIRIEELAQSFQTLERMESPVAAGVAGGSLFTEGEARLGANVALDVEDREFGEFTTT